MKQVLLIIMISLNITDLCAQQMYSASFVSKLGVDTVSVETYNMIHNHLFGKAFFRYPQDELVVFDIRFYPNGSIQTFSRSGMRIDNTAVSSGYTEGLFCANDTCAWFSASEQNKNREYVNRRPAKQMDFIGGWIPLLSLIEWNCIRLVKSGQPMLPITMINDYIGIRQVAVSRGQKDTLIFGGPFLEYAKIVASPEGRIISYDGTGTPWNYTVTKLKPIDVDEVARRMSMKPKIGNPSPPVQAVFAVANDTIKLSYSRPFKRGRTIFGGIVPYDSVWRTGAGDPTKIMLPYDIQFNKTIVPKGQYSLYTIPQKDKWTLIFNTDLNQWPTDPDRSKDLALIPLSVQKPAKQSDQFTIYIESEKDGGIIKFTWDETEAYAPFKKVKK